MWYVGERALAGAQGKGGMPEYSFAKLSGSNVETNWILVNYPWLHACIEQCEQHGRFCRRRWFCEST